MINANLTGWWSRGEQHGFTLIELMVVMLIVGILATTVTLSLRPDTHRQLADEAYRLARVLEQATDSAEIGSPVALVWDVRGYRFQRQTNDGTWMVIGESLLKPHIWPAGISGGGLSVEGRVWPKREPALLWEGGRANALAMTLQNEHSKLTITLSPLGRAQVEGRS